MRGICLVQAAFRQKGHCPVETRYDATFVSEITSGLCSKAKTRTSVSQLGVVSSQPGNSSLRDDQAKRIARDPPEADPVGTLKPPTFPTTRLHVWAHTEFALDCFSWELADVLLFFSYAFVIQALISGARIWDILRWGSFSYRGNDNQRISLNLHQIWLRM